MSTLQITFRSVSDSPAIKHHIHKYVKKLTHNYKRINTCHVVVDLAQKHKHQGKLFSVSIDVATPGKEIVVSRKRNENVYVAIRDGFYALEKLFDRHIKRKAVHINKGLLHRNNELELGSSEYIPICET